MTEPPEPPEHLSAASAALWASITGDYALESPHQEILRIALEARDRAEEAREILAEAGPIVHDRWGMPRKHPAVGVEEQARLAYLRGLRELDLEGEPHPGYRRG